MSVTDYRHTRELLAATLSVPGHVVYQNFVHETVILNLETSRYHGVNPTGGAMLDALARAPRVADAAQNLARELGRPLQEIEIDLCDLCAELLGRGLLVRAPACAG